MSTRDSQLLLMTNASERQPELFVEIDLGDGRSSRVAVFDGDEPDMVADKISKHYGITNEAQMREIANVIRLELGSTLQKIDEEEDPH